MLPRSDAPPVLSPRSFVRTALVEARARRRARPLLHDSEAAVPFLDAEEDRQVSDDWEVQVRYWGMRLDCMTHSLAEVLATGAFPGVRTDSSFNAGRCNGNQFEATPWLGDHHRRLAEAAGVSTVGKHYCAGLADFPGDPTAWVSGRGDVLAVAQAKGFKVTGAVEYTPPEAEPQADVVLAPELHEAAIAARLAAVPGLRRDDVYDETYRLRAGLVDPNPPLVEDLPDDVD